jgi:hypothetical protein
MAQLISITSEALQATIRRLLPSQQGFGEDLQASNVITPIIDLTPTAEGSEVRADLQTAVAFASQTAFSAIGSNQTLAQTAGFWRVIGAVVITRKSAGNRSAGLRLSDGTSSVQAWQMRTESGSADGNVFTDVDLTVFLRPGDRLIATATSDAQFTGSYRQVADVSGNLVNPSGFTPQ